MARRGPGEGSIYQRKDGRWAGALELGWHSGKRQRRHVIRNSRREVQLALADLRRRHERGLRVDADDQTVRQFLKRWLAWKRGRIRPHTAAGYKGYLEGHVMDELGDIRLLKLRVEDVDGLLETKSVRSRRTVALPDLAVHALKDHKRAQRLARMQAADVWVKTEYVFVGPTGRPLLPFAISAAFKEHAKDVGLPEMTFHQPRHGAATLMLASGVPLKVVQETLGHSTCAFTADIYGHVAAEVQRMAAVAMDEALGDQAADKA